MATDGNEDKRHVWGPRPVGGLVAGLTRPAFRKRSPATAQIMADWGVIVGPALAAATAPRRLTGATLTLACSGPVAMEMQHLSGELIARINGHLGRVAIDRLRFVQEALPGPAATLAEPAKPGKPPAIPGLREGALNDALARLAQALQEASRRRD